MLTFELDRTTWKAGEPITGSMTLAFVGSGKATLSGSGGGPFGIEIVEMTGRRVMGAGWSDDCSPMPLGADGSLHHPVVPSGGGWDASDPDASFYASLWDGIEADHVLRLPAGTWKLTADAIFIAAAACAAPETRLSVPLQVIVTG